MNIIISILTGIILSYFSFSVFYQLIMAVASTWPMRSGKAREQLQRQIAVFIPAYKEDAVIMEVAEAALQQSYPREKYDVIIIADSMQASTIEQLRQLPIKVIVVSFEKSTKSRALRKAMSELPDDFYEVAVILDADNVMRPDFLSLINRDFNSGNKAVQGQRAAKNLDTAMAVLDGASEAINNNLLCKGPQQFNLSARLAGSGMAFDYQLFKSTMATIDAIGGFDKELELKLGMAGQFIAYNEQAIVLDEKIRSAKHFSRQRSRWIAAQYIYLNRFMGKAIRELLVNGNIDFFNKTLQLILPPRLILPSVLFVGMIIAFLIDSALSWYWVVLFVGNVATFSIALPRAYYSVKFLKAFPHLFIAFTGAVLALLKIRKANKSFIHTPHGAKTRK